MLILFLMVASLTPATVYMGRVTDSNGQGLGYATIYPVNDPVVGTATNREGYFSFETILAPNSQIIISYIGYEKQMITLPPYSSTPLLPDTVVFPTVVLTEQPIGLEEMVVSAQKPKYANKRKQMAALLQAVYTQLEADWPNQTTRYHLVSDVRMDSEGEAWGMEQMIATIASTPLPQTEPHRDSVQFHGEYCKRYFNPSIRARANTIYTDSTLEQMNTKTGRNKDRGTQMRNAAAAIDSGVVVHKGLFVSDNALREMQGALTDIKHWSVNKENDGETVLTYTYKKNMMGIFIFHLKHHYILDSQTLSLLRTATQSEVHIKIPFGVKLDANELQILNMLNMSEQQIEKFRLRQAHAYIHFNTIYQRRDDKLFILEKNLHTDASIVGAKKQTIPVEVNATQRVVSIDYPSRPLYYFELTRRLRREIVEIY